MTDQVEENYTLTMRTRVAIECARKIVDHKSTAQHFPIPAEDIAAALVELHDILHAVAGERAGYRVLTERYQAAFLLLQKEIVDGTGKIVDTIISGVDTALKAAENIILEEGAENMASASAKRGTA